MAGDASPELPVHPTGIDDDTPVASSLLPRTRLVDRLDVFRSQLEPLARKATFGLSSLVFYIRCQYVFPLSTLFGARACLLCMSEACHISPSCMLRCTYTCHVLLHDVLCVVRVYASFSRISCVLFSPSGKHAAVLPRTPYFLDAGRLLVFSTNFPFLRLFSVRAARRR